MSRVAPVVPAENSILCESCGYTLDGIPTDSNCPECGRPVASSTVDDGRVPAGWDMAGRGRIGRFFSTTVQILFRPSYFFRHTTARNALRPAWEFAMIYWIIAAILFGGSAWIHASWYSGMTGWTFVHAPMLVGLIVGTFLMLWWTTLFASRLTVWEAKYRGIRLPREVVLRGLYYHAAHYVPVGIMAIMTTGGYVRLFHRGVFGFQSATPYLWVLSGEVIVGAMYLFFTYWAAMRNMMYANR